MNNQLRGYLSLGPVCEWDLGGKGMGRQDWETVKCWREGKGGYLSLREL